MQLETSFLEAPETRNFRIVYMKVSLNHPIVLLRMRLEVAGSRFSYP